MQELCKGVCPHHSIYVVPLVLAGIIRQSDMKVMKFGNKDIKLSLFTAIVVVSMGHP